MPKVAFAELVIVNTGDLCGDIDVDVEGYVSYDDESDRYDIEITDVTGCLFYIRETSTWYPNGTRETKRTPEQIDISQVIRENPAFIKSLESQVIESHPQGRG